MAHTRLPFWHLQCVMHRCLPNESLRSRPTNLLCAARSSKSGTIDSQDGSAFTKTLKTSNSIYFLLLVAFLFLVLWPGAPSSILAPSSDARSP